MIVIANGYTVNSGADRTDLDRSVFAWDNLVNTGNLTAAGVVSGTAEDPAHPTLNLANPSTYLYFAQFSAGEDIYFQVALDGSVAVDSLAVAGHNFGTNLAQLQVFGATTTSLGAYVYVALTNVTVLTDDQPVIFAFAAANYIAIKLVMTHTRSAILRAAVLFVGKLLSCERHFQTTFTPLPLGREPEVTSGLSENGQFLGRLEISSKLETTGTISYMSPDWYLTYMDPFIAASKTGTFFVAWAPGSYPHQVAYAWMMNKPKPEIHDAIGLMQITLQMQGVAE